MKRIVIENPETRIVRRWKGLLRDYDYRWDGEYLHWTDFSGRRHKKYFNSLTSAMDYLLPLQDENFKERYHKIVADGNEEIDYSKWPNPIYKQGKNPNYVTSPEVAKLKKQIAWLRDTIADLQAQSIYLGRSIPTGHYKRQLEALEKQLDQYRIPDKENPAKRKTMRERCKEILHGKDQEPTFSYYREAENPNQKFLRVSVVDKVNKYLTAREKQIILYLLNNNLSEGRVRNKDYFIKHIEGDLYEVKIVEKVKSFTRPPYQYINNRVKVRVNGKNPKSKNSYYDLNKEEIAELLNLWHLSKVPYHSRYDRMQWTTKEFHKLHPEHSHMIIYKNLDRQIARW